MVKPSSKFLPTRGVEGGIGKARKSIASLGASAAKAGADGSRGMDIFAAATARSSKAIDSQVARLRLSAALLGKSATEAKLFELSQRGASTAQIAAASAALNSVDAYKAQQAAIDRVQTSARRYAAVFATVGVSAAAALLAIGKNSTDALDAFNDLSDSTGSSIENISALDRVARETGVGFESMSSTLVKFNQVLSKTDEDSDAAARVLKSLGLNAQALKQIDPAEALRQTAVALSQFADDGKKARAVQVLFAKSIQEAAPFLKDLADQTSLVATTSSAAAKSAEAFNKQIFSLKADAQDAARVLASSLVPSLSELSSEFSAGMKNANGFIDAILTFGTINPFRSQVGNLKGLREELAGLEADRARYVRAGSDTSGIDAAIKNTSRQLGFLKDLEARNVLVGLGDTGDAVSRRLTPRALPMLDVPDKPSKEGKGKAAFSGLSYQDTITQSVGKLFEDSDLTKARVFSDTMTKLDDLFFSGAINADLYDSSMKKLTGSTSSAADQASQFIKDQERLGELMGNTASAALEQQRNDMALLSKALQDGVIAEGAYLEAVTARLNLTSSGLKETNSLAEELGLTFSSAFEDAIVSGKGFSGVLKGIAQDILRMTTREFVTEPLGKAAKDIFKGGFSSIASMFSGGLTGGGFGTGVGYGNLDLGGFFADGGNPPVGKMSVVGERGPELFIPRTSGTIISNEALRGGGKSPVTIHISVDASGSSAQGNSESSKELGRMIGSAVRSVLVQEQMPGGILA